MEFDLPCECGHVHQVSIGLAGTTIDCECGRTVTVPSSIVLREQRGLSGVEPEPELVIPAMFDSGELPPRECMQCGQRADVQHQLRVECERYSTKYRGNSAAEFGVVFGVFGALIADIFLASTARRRGDVEIHGRDVIVPAFLSSCHSCAASIAPRRSGRWIRLLAWLCAVAAVGLVWTGNWRLAGIAIGAWFAGLLLAKWLVSMEQRRLRRMIGDITEYAELFQKYPAARITY